MSASIPLHLFTTLAVIVALFAGITFLTDMRFHDVWAIYDHPGGYDRCHSAGGSIPASTACLCSPASTVRAALAADLISDTRFHFSVCRPDPGTEIRRRGPSPPPMTSSLPDQNAAPSAAVDDELDRVAPQDPMLRSESPPGQLRPAQLGRRRIARPRGGDGNRIARRSAAAPTSRS